MAEAEHLQERSQQDQRRAETAVPGGAAPRRPSRAAAVIALQRAAGNQAVAGIIRGGTPHAPVAQRLWDAPLLTAETFQVAVGGVPQNRNRVKVVEAILGSKVNRATGPEPPTALTGPGGVLDPDAGRWDRGHVVALSLGGTNVAANVVPMGAGFNRVVWRDTERLLSVTRRRLLRRAKLKVRIEAQYNGPDPRVPSDLVYASQASRPVPDALPSGSVVVKGPQAKTSALTAAAAGAGLADAKNTRAAWLSPGARLSPEQARDLAKYKQDEGVAYPVGGGPYSDLDFHGGFVGKGQGTSPFNAAQRLLILNANRARNSGVLKSDAPDEDPHKILNEGEDETRLNARVEIDHVVPKSNGGGNYFANARVVSWELNNKLARVKPTRKMMDPRKLGSRHQTRQRGKLTDLSRIAVKAVSENKTRMSVKEIKKYILANSSLDDVSALELKQALKAAETAGLLTVDRGGYVLSGWRRR